MPDSLGKVAVLGAGSWGTALAIQLAKNQVDVNLWGHLPAEIEQLQQDRENRRFLPGLAFPEQLTPQTDLQTSLSGVDEVLIVVPSHAFAAVLQRIKPLLPPQAAISWATKGLDPHSNLLLSEVARRELGPAHPMTVISGPTFAREVAMGLPTAIVIASTDASHAETLTRYLKDDAFRPYTSEDIIGVQIGGAAKNIMAIAAGICDGLGFGANTRAALITRGLVEITRLGTALGGHTETFMGLAGLGDLVLTCTDDQSRNRRLGLALASGMNIEQAKQQIGQEVEGIATAREVYKKATELNIEMPITEQAYRVLYEGLDPHDAVTQLLSRETRAEQD
ncbi:MAG: NAD(P)H-dependent glycerol-3-phosphate dehydrogenase [Chromatiales bacterium]|jgi:glycerol-3-phosphate dehydrogenase (NAD(P)+)